MGISDIPASFGQSFFLRSFFPASLATTLYGITFYPFLKETFWFSLDFENKILVWIAVSLFIGIMLNSIDLFIYQFYEGIRFWPEALKNYFYKKHEVKFNKIVSGLDETYDKIDEIESLLDKSGDADKPKLESELRELHNKSSKLWKDLRLYPYNPEKKYKRYPEYPTDFGNVLAEYEQYSERQYGMHMMVFWQHLWYTISQEIKDDLELRSAKADFNVYVSFLLFSHIFIGTIGAFFYWSLKLGIVTLIVSIILGYFSYKIAVSEHKAFGRYIKAIFDIYRFELAEKLSITISNNPDEDRKSWTKWRHYLLDYKPIEQD